MGIAINSDSFEKEVLKADRLVLVDFWAPWCMPCKMVAPIIEAVAEECKDTVKVCKVDIDQDSQLAAHYGIMSIPTLMVFRNGQAVDKRIGIISKEELSKALEPHIG